jgi:hypothetical protein
MKNGQGIGLVVICYWMAFGLHGSHHGIFVSVAFASGMELDSSNWHTAVRDLVVFAPGSEGGHQATITMSCINSLVAPDFFKVNSLDLSNAGAYLTEPLLKPEKAHTATFKALGLEINPAMHNLTLRQCCPASACAKING